METPKSSFEAEMGRRFPVQRLPARRLLGAIVAPAAAALVLLGAPGAHAQTGVDAASTNGKGIAAGILLGAEAVVFAEAIIGVKPAWAYMVGAGVGAAGGGVGGYFLEDSLSPKTATLLLAGGMVLAIPATIAALSASSYEPPRDYVQDDAPSDEPVDEPPLPETSAASRSTLSFRAPLPSLVGIDDGHWSMGLPAIALLDVYSPELRRTYDLPRVTELRVPVLAMRF